MLRIFPGIFWRRAARASKKRSSKQQDAVLLYEMRGAVISHDTLFKIALDCRAGSDFRCLAITKAIDGVYLDASLVERTKDFLARLILPPIDGIPLDGSPDYSKEAFRFVDKFVYGYFYEEYGKMGEARKLFLTKYTCFKDDLAGSDLSKSAGVPSNAQ